MKKKNIYIVGLILLVSCSIKQLRIPYIGNWTEKSLDFSESINFREDNNIFDFILDNKYFGCGGNPKRFIWLRKSDNLADFFDIIKKIGMQKILSKQDYNRTLKDVDLANEWKGKSLNIIVKNLIRKYNSKNDYNYYSKFWKRRQSEHNDTIVLDILKQIDSFYNLDKINIADKINRNDLYDLIFYNVQLNETKDSVELKHLTINYFNHLKSRGLEHSSYNLINETYLNKYVIDKRDSLLSTLHYDTISEEKYWDTRNNANWIKTYRDNGP